jgi:hypothetical protein
MYKTSIQDLKKQLADIKGLTVGDDVVHVHSQLVKAATHALEKFEKNLTIASFI